MAIDTVLLQVIDGERSSHEVRTVRMACLMSDDLVAVNVRVEQLNEFSPKLRTGQAMPVGTVEFVRQAMQAAGILEPTPNPYPNALRAWLHRTVRVVSASQVGLHTFVKPADDLKRFTGFVLDRRWPAEEMSAHENEQYAALAMMAPDDRVWISTPVRFVSEWRFYVLDGIVLGGARYDDLEDENAPAPDLREVKAAAAAADSELGHPFALDMGVLEDGTTALVETNDGWGTGHYGQAVTPQVYLKWLIARWETLSCEITARPSAPL